MMVHQNVKVKKMIIKLTTTSQENQQQVKGMK